MPSGTHVTVSKSKAHTLNQCVSMLEVINQANVATRESDDLVTFARTESRLAQSGKREDAIAKIEIQSKSTLGIAIVWFLSSRPTDRTARASRMHQCFGTLMPRTIVDMNN
nr:hypothetical protein CFP56_09006 [Quercus suber]